MEKPTYVVTVGHIELPPLASGTAPFFVEFPYSREVEDNPLPQLRRLWMLFRWARHAQVMVLDSTSGPLQPDLLACIFMRLLPKRPVVIMTGDMWNKGNPLKYRFQKLALKLADPSIQRYVVQSYGEQAIFPQVWGVAAEKVRPCLYNFTFTDEEIHASEIASKGYIFAGGNPHRDYDSLLETARRLPNRQFIIATKRLEGREDIPPNVQVVQVPHLEFIRLMREADAVVTPIKSGLTRATGQQTYLNAMRMGKVAIVNGKDVHGVTDYIQHHANGIITDGTPEGYAQAIEWVYANPDAAKEMGQVARETASEFTYERHVRTMASIIEEAIAESGR